MQGPRAVLLGLLAAAQALAGQVPAAAPASSRPVLCGTRLLAEERPPLPGREALDEWLAAHPASKPLGRSGAAQAEIAVGTALPFAVAGVPALVSATCEYVGDHLYVFVEDRAWDTNGGSVLQSHVDSLGLLFDRRCPADPDRGVYELEVETFGPPPDVDGYERIFVLVLDIPDARVVGYFDPEVAAHPVPELRRDMLFIDELALRRYDLLYLGRGTLAHELQHLISWGQDPDEDLWIDEGMSGYAEEVAGYPEADPGAVPAFLQRPDTALMEWRDASQNYGMTYLFVSALAEWYGRPLVRRLAAEPRNGRAGLDAALAGAGLTADFGSVWGRWVAGNWAVDDPDLGYAALRGRRVASLLVERLPLDPKGAVVGGQWGATTVVFRTPGDVAVQLDGGDAGRFRAWAYALRQGRGELEELELDSANRGMVTVRGIDSLALVVGRTSLAGREFEVAAAQAVPTLVGRAEALPLTWRLEPAYPNPFNSLLRVPLVLDRDRSVELEVVDALGQRVRLLHRGLLGPGRHELTWDGRDNGGRAAASGRYLVVLRSVGADPAPAPRASAALSVTYLQ
ncbi:MAG: FlgD immunoglobulin-like domain containing protein [Gemmatimonadota bacterium]